MKNICFITKSPSYDLLITQLRKRGINALKRNISNEDLTRFDAIIVDLSYPLEEAYIFLEETKNNHSYSDIIIIAAISHKSQVKKLRSFALGCDGYISSSIDHQDLLQKLKELEDPANHLLHAEFDDLIVDIDIDVSITHISENGLVIKSKVSLGQHNKNIQLQSPLLDDLILDDSLKTTLGKANPIAQKSYLAEVQFLGITESDRLKIRKLVHSWST